MPGRNLAVLTEAATRTHILRAKGVDPAAAFMARHSHFLERANPVTPCQRDHAPTLVIVSGMSGSGKSVALKTFEDLGFYCVDNLPAELLTQFVESVLQSDDVATSSPSASTCATAMATSAPCPNRCRRSARSGSIRSWCSSMPATMPCSSVMPTRAAATR